MRLCRDIVAPVRLGGSAELCELRWCNVSQYYYLLTLSHTALLPSSLQFSANSTYLSGETGNTSSGPACQPPCLSYQANQDGGVLSEWWVVTWWHPPGDRAPSVSLLPSITGEMRGECQRNSVQSATGITSLVGGKVTITRDCPCHLSLSTTHKTITPPQHNIPTLSLLCLNINHVSGPVSNNIRTPLATLNPSLLHFLRVVGSIPATAAVSVCYHLIWILIWSSWETINFTSST